MSAGGSNPFIFSGGSSLISFPLLHSLLPLAKGNCFAYGCEKGFCRLLCLLKQTAATCLHVNGAGGDQAPCLAGLLGQAAGSDAQHSQHIVNANLICLFLDTHFRACLPTGLPISF